MNTLRTMAVVACAAAAPLFARAGETGVLWENTVQMEGMPVQMPAFTSRFCSQKGGLQQPPKDERQGQDCQMKDLVNDGRHMTWKMVCKDGTSGEGKLDYAKDRYDGVTTVRMNGGMTMTMKMKGRLLGEACDLQAQQRSMDAMKQQAEESRVRAEASQQQLAEGLCAQGVDQMNPQFFDPRGGVGCKDPKAKDEFCARLVTWQGYGLLQSRGPAAAQDVAKAAKLCGKDPRALPPVVCAGALQDASGSYPDASALDYVATSCPPEKALLAKRECAGRSYTGRDAPAAPYQRFCTRYAGDLLRKAPAKAPASTEGAAKDKAVEEGKKLLKGLFGR